MAILPIFERKETKAIMEQLMRGERTAAELNEIIVLNSIKELCSTSTLYRRLRDLLLASILEKKNNKYFMTKYGKDIFEEFQNQSQKISTKDKEILSLFTRSRSSKDVFDRTSISPNKLQEIIGNLIDEELIEEEGQKQQRKGRPKRLYKVTPRGKEIISKDKKLKRKTKKK